MNPFIALVGALALAFTLAVSVNKSQQTPTAADIESSQHDSEMVKRQAEYPQAEKFLDGANIPI